MTDPYRAERNATAEHGGNVLLVPFEDRSSSSRRRTARSEITSTDCQERDQSWYKVVFESYACDEPALSRSRGGRRAEHRVAVVVAVRQEEADARRCSAALFRRRGASAPPPASARAPPHRRAPRPASRCPQRAEGEDPRSDARGRRHGRHRRVRARAAASRPRSRRGDRRLEEVRNRRARHRSRDCAGVALSDLELHSEFTRGFHLVDRARS